MSALATWRGLGWRLGFARRWLAAALAARTIEAVSRIGPLRLLPRRVLIPVERALLTTSGADLFEADFYLARNPDVVAAGIDPLDHFLRDGWREGRAPNPQFDDGHYRAVSGLFPSVPVSALAHFLAYGHRRGLAPVPAADADALGRALPALEVARLDGYRVLVAGKLARPDEGRPDLDRANAALAALDPLPVRDSAVDVLVPVHSGRAETLNTLAHALTARNTTPAEIIVVDDASPDAALAADLRGLAERGLITLVRNARNQGFAASINRGAALHPDRDVVWLNADTEVYDGWIDRLRATAYRRSNVATVTPLTNNGTICSYPRFNADNPGELELPWREVDRLAAAVNRGRRVVSPTAVGFATYVRRDALSDVGPLDADTFGRGYGEENDFSQRAIARGWINLLAGDVFVRHFGATSFRGERAPRVASAMGAMDRLHPRYHREVRDFVERDPLGPARRALDLARLKARCGGRNALIVTHSLGGGTAQHVQEETARLEAAGWTVVHLAGGAGGRGTARLSVSGAGPMPSLAALDLDGGQLWQILGALHLRRVDVHHLIDFPPRTPEILQRRLTRAGLEWSVMVHDYFAVCPRINMVDRQGHYCGEPGARACQLCLVRRGSPAGRPDILAWRRRHGAFLSAAAEVRVPDADVAARLARYYPGLRTTVVPHDDAVPRETERTVRRGGGLRIAVIGAIGPIKGFDAILGLARHAAMRRLDVQLTVIGYTRNDVAAREAGITVTGAYTNDRVQELIDQADPDVIWIPSVWPETYCYTLSIALRSGRPVTAFDIGAQAARVRRAGTGTLLPLEDAYRPHRLLGKLHLAADAGHASFVEERAEVA